jgi:hypothetical protein
MITGWACVCITRERSTEAERSIASFSESLQQQYRQHLAMTRLK